MPVPQWRKKVGRHDGNDGPWPRNAKGILSSNTTWRFSLKGQAPCPRENLRCTRQSSRSKVAQRKSGWTRGPVRVAQLSWTTRASASNVVIRLLARFRTTTLGGMLGAVKGIQMQFGRRTPWILCPQGALVGQMRPVLCTMNTLVNSYLPPNGLMGHSKTASLRTQSQR